MKIAIDIDGVLTNLERFCLDYLSKFCVENDIKYSIGQSDYDEAKTFGLDKKTGDAFWDKYLLEYAKHEKCRPFASEVIKQLI